MFGLSIITAASVFEARRSHHPLSPALYAIDQRIRRSFLDVDCYLLHDKFFIIRTIDAQFYKKVRRQGVNEISNALTVSPFGKTRIPT